jgi:hypothetical protein
MHSKAIRALSVIILPGIKALWFMEIIFCSNGRSRFTMHLETTLYTTLHKLIGVKSFIDSGCFVLGMSTIQVSLAPYGIILEAKKS